MAQEQQEGADLREDWMVCFAQEVVLYEKACQKYVEDIIRLRSSNQAREQEAR